ncbi:MAG: DUF1460 domain-containing protein [Gemmatimonadetes bacterium]|nr:DUF1460 domain-containing protein [Gemmatimonadota bacterium]
MASDPTRREALARLLLLSAALGLPRPLLATDPDIQRLIAWVERLRAEGFLAEDAPSAARWPTPPNWRSARPTWRARSRVPPRRRGPRGGTTRALLTRFRLRDAGRVVHRVVARLAQDPFKGMWARFGTEMERMRYRDGRRRGYASRLHYFSEWIAEQGTARPPAGPHRGPRRCTRPPPAPLHDRAPRQLPRPRRRHHVRGHRRHGADPRRCPAPGDPHPPHRGSQRPDRDRRRAGLCHRHPRARRHPPPSPGAAPTACSACCTRRSRAAWWRSRGSR